MRGLGNNSTGRLNGKALDIYSSPTHGEYKNIPLSV